MCANDEHLCVRCVCALVCICAHVVGRCAQWGCEHMYSCWQHARVFTEHTHMCMCVHMSVCAFTSHPRAAPAMATRLRGLASAAHSGGAAGGGAPVPGSPVASCSAAQALRLLRAARCQELYATAVPSDHCQLRLCGGTGQCWDPPGSPRTPSLGTSRGCLREGSPGPFPGALLTRRGRWRPIQTSSSSSSSLASLEREEKSRSTTACSSSSLCTEARWVLEPKRRQKACGREGSVTPAPTSPGGGRWEQCRGCGDVGARGAWHRRVLCLGAEQQCHHGDSRSGEGREPLERVPVLGWPQNAVTRPPRAAEPSHCPHRALQPLTSALFQLSSQGKKPRQPPLTGTQPGVQSDSSRPAEGPGERGAVGAQWGTVGLGGGAGHSPHSAGTSSRQPSSQSPGVHVGAMSLPWEDTWDGARSAPCSWGLPRLSPPPL